MLQKNVTVSRLLDAIHEDSVPSDTSEDSVSKAIEKTAGAHGPPCAIHAGKGKDKFCTNAACRLLICETCLKERHLTHEIKTRLEIQEELESKVSDLRSRCERRKEYVDGRVRKVEKQRGDVISAMRIKKVEIERAYEEKLHLMKKNKESLIAKLQSLESVYLTELDAIVARYINMTGDLDDSIAPVKSGKLVDLERGGLDRHDKRSAEVDRLLRKPVYEDYAIDIAVASKSVRFCKADPEDLSLGEIENDEIKTAREMSLIRRGLRNVGREVKISLSMKVVMEVELRKIEGLAALTKNSVVVAHGRFRSGAEVVSVTGKSSEFFEKDVGTVAGIAILSDGRPVAYDGGNGLGIFNPDGSAMTEKFEDLPRSPISFHNDQCDRVYAVDGGREISVFTFGRRKRKRKIVTREGGHRQICVTGSGAIITSTGNLEPSTVAVYDTDGRRHNSLVAEVRGEHLYAAVDGEDNVFLARIRDNVVRLSYCKIKDECLIEWMRYQDLELDYSPLRTWSRWHFVCLTPNLVALARDTVLYFIQI